MQKLVETSCTDFVEALASKASVPGGGSAAALAGALGAALCAMVGNFTIGKKKCAATEEDVKEILKKCSGLKNRLLELVDADAQAFEPLAKAYAIPKDNPTHDAVLEAATLHACKAPQEMAALCCQAIELLEEMMSKGSAMLISDVGCGALLCKAALESAAMNVFINTKTLQNRVRAKAIEAEMNFMLKNYEPRAALVAKTVAHRIREGG